jgi:hypothetical protein
VAAVQLMNRPDIGLILVGPDTEGVLENVDGPNIYKLGPIYDEAGEASPCVEEPRRIRRLGCHGRRRHRKSWLTKRYSMINIRLWTYKFITQV